MNKIMYEQLRRTNANRHTTRISRLTSTLPFNLFCALPIRAAVNIKNSNIHAKPFTVEATTMSYITETQAIKKKVVTSMAN